jgi:hypothetical protein
MDVHLAAWKDEMKADLTDATMAAYLVEQLVVLTVL